MSIDKANQPQGPAPAAPAPANWRNTAGNIAKTSPAAKYLAAHGVAPADYNQYGARRGNHEIMVRGTFANIRLKNALAGGVEGGV